MPSTFDWTSVLIWWRSGQPAVVSATFTVTCPSGPTWMSSTMPSSTMLTWSSGSMTPASMPRTSSTAGAANRGGAASSGASGGAWGESVIGITLIKPGSALKICPGLATVNGVDLAVLKALGDETRYAMYRELATSTQPLSAQDLADRLGLHAN